MQVINISSLGKKFIDLRDSLPGDSYKWNWIRALDQINYLAIHHTASPDNQTPEEITNYHIKSNKWGGIGYHFLVDKEGVVFYVGDIQTARANVANLNEQVIGIALIGNFTEGRAPTPLQLDSTHKLCEYFINNSFLPNVTSWDKVRGHKELPNQSTICPGDDWTNWRIQIVEGLNLPSEESEPTTQTSTLKSQVDSLQDSLSSVNQQVISLQESLLQREDEITNLKKALTGAKEDSTLTIVGALINLYRLIFPPGKAALA